MAFGPRAFQAIRFISFQSARLLREGTIEEMGNLMRNKRNLDLYGGGIEVTEKECAEFIRFAERVIDRVRMIAEQR